MIFIAHIEFYDDFDNENKTDRVIFPAANFPTAMEYLDAYYGENIEKITLLEPVSDSNTVIHIDEIAEAHIREHEHNSF